MPRESKKTRGERAVEVCRRLCGRYPDAECALHHQTPFQLTIAVLLSAQTTDAQVNKVTPELFRRWPDAASMSCATPAEVGEVIHSLGFWRTKADHCVGCAQTVMADFAGDVPQTMEELQTLPGVGRKTANIVMNEGFGHVAGIAVDTHVYRIATRLALTRAATPGEAEKDLLACIPQELWGPVNHTWILFGREICDARKPLCAECPLADLCPSAFKPPTSTRRRPSGAHGQGKGSGRQA
ncbi:MAG: endonuclease III [Atopobiaceae bacterium]|jgi:endonuclease-3|nr:endonuclease III [Atopobiaceae bacterium]MCH4181424.1 endonuclease III [Atopobiaceae bacterium]MCH4215003.1 endonuclease III [Atopobiaceae bacterium]MCH4230026.1 endonuclease III [Atopobiaceae bacterium]MCH4277178.1 endonuclease III [Atopobiaceae bacterium]